MNRQTLTYAVAATLAAFSLACFALAASAGGYASATVYTPQYKSYALQLVPPVYQIGAQYQQEAQAEQQFRHSPGQRRLENLELYYEAMKDAAIIAGANQAQPQGFAAPPRFPHLTALCLRCHTPGSDEGPLYPAGTDPTPDAIDRMLDRAFAGEMPPDKPLTPAEFQALQDELIPPGQQQADEPEVQHAPPQQPVPPQQAVRWTPGQEQQTPKPPAPPAPPEPSVDQPAWTEKQKQPWKPPAPE